MQMQMGQPGQPQLPPLRIRGPVLFGLLVLVAFIGTFGAWAAFAKIQSAAIAPGVVSGERKTIQHLEGGIVKAINVKEGSEVAAGDVLVTLDTTKSFANLEINNNRLISEYAKMSRLIAERDGVDSITWVPELDEFSAETFVSKVKDTQLGDFNARRRTLESQASILWRRVQQFKEEQRGYRSQIHSQQKRSELLTEEIATQESLLKDGYVGKLRLLELRRQLVDAEGLLEQSSAAVGRLDQSISGAELESVNLRATRLNEVLEQLQLSQSAIRELTEQVSASKDIANRTGIVAPISGSVVELNVLTEGGVIQPAQPLMSIVSNDGKSSDGKYIIKARVNPVDIDQVHVGLEAQVRFTPFNQRSTQPSLAVVKTVSKDRLTDEKSGADYYLAQVELAELATEQLRDEITSGMPAEVLILTGNRTPFEYFIAPIERSFERAFLEN